MSGPAGMVVRDYARNVPAHHSITTVFHIPATGYYGYTSHFPGQRSHYRIEWCATVQNALDSCDPLVFARSKALSLGEWPISAWEN